MSAIPMRTLILPAVAHIAAAYGAMGGAAPAAMMAAVGLQESLFEARDQLEMQNGILVPGRPGPAMGFWQFEKSGGVKGVMTHPASRLAAQELATAAGVPFEEDAIWRFFGTMEGDELAAAFARLLLLTDPQPLPTAVAESQEVAWRYYLRNWRPGSPHPEFWGKNWRLALEAVAAVDIASASGAAVATPPPQVGGNAGPPAETIAALLARVAALERRLNAGAAALS